MNISALISTITATLYLALTIHAPGAEKPLSAAQKSQALYQQGMAAESAGQATAAQQAYEEALRLNPGNANARYRLGQLKSNFDKVASKGRKAKLDTIVIPEFKVDDATLSEALTALQQLIEKESKEPFSSNFVIQDPGGNLAASKVSLVLKSIPAGGILNYLLEMSSAKARYDEYAIVIMPR